jgi:hypothetical protein
VGHGSRDTGRGAVQQHAETFSAHVQASAGADHPTFVKDEFNAFLEFGSLASCFLRLRRGDCSHDQRAAFSCTRRGIRPTCGVRRVTKAAANLVGHVILHVPVHQ